MKRIEIILLAIASIGFFACSEDDYSNALSGLSCNETLLSDVEHEEIEIETELIIDPETIPAKAKTRAWSSDMNNYYFTANMRAISGMPFTIQNVSTSKYIYTNGKGQELKMGATAPNDRTRFYVQTYAPSTGIPYQIYSQKEKKPITIGIKNNRKFLMTANDENFTMVRSWDLFRSSTDGSIVFENQGLFTSSGSHGGYWAVLQQAGDRTDFGENSNNSTQKWVITPDAEFTISSLQFVNPANARITKLADKTVTLTKDNWASSEQQWDNVPFSVSVSETSQFIPVRDIAWKIASSFKTFARPSIFQGNIDIYPPADEFQQFVYYSTTQTTTTRTMSADGRRGNNDLKIPANRRMVATYYYSQYRLEVDYEMPIKYGTVTVTVRGTWKGTIFIDENRPPVTTLTPLDEWGVRSIPLTEE